MTVETQNKTGATPGVKAVCLDCGVDNANEPKILYQGNSVNSESIAAHRAQSHDSFWGLSHIVRVIITKVGVR